MTNCTAETGEDIEKKTVRRGRQSTEPFLKHSDPFFFTNPSHFLCADCDSMSRCEGIGEDKDPAKIRRGGEGGI